MRVNGRIPVCGMISQYNATETVAGPSNLANIIGNRLLLKGFIVTDYSDRANQFYADMAGWIASGEIQYKETVLEGIKRAPEAFIGLFTGTNMGKMLVKL